MASKQAHAPQWQASDARHRFSEVVDAAASGAPQFVRRRDGREVVVVSKEYFEGTKPTLQSVLLTGFTFEHDDGSFDAALAEGRRLTGAVLTPHFKFERETADDVRHEHRQRTPRPKKATA